MEPQGFGMRIQFSKGHSGIGLHRPARIITHGQNDFGFGLSGVDQRPHLCHLRTHARQFLIAAIRPPIMLQHAIAHHLAPPAAHSPAKEIDAAGAMGNGAPCPQPHQSGRGNGDPVSETGLLFQDQEFSASAAVVIEKKLAGCAARIIVGSIDVRCFAQVKDVRVIFRGALEICCDRNFRGKLLHQIMAPAGKVHIGLRLKALIFQRQRGMHMFAPDVRNAFKLIQRKRPEMTAPAFVQMLNGGVFFAQILHKFTMADLAIAVIAIANFIVDMPHADGWIMRIMLNDRAVDPAREFDIFRLV